MNIESRLWHVISYNDAYANIIQKSTGVLHAVTRGKLPDTHTLAMASEAKFDRICREAFHGEIAERKTIA